MTDRLRLFGERAPDELTDLLGVGEPAVIAIGADERGAELRRRTQAFSGLPHQRGTDHVGDRCGYGGDAGGMRRRGA